MGYDVHITRKNAWQDERGPAITLDEWLEYAARDPEMRVDGFAETPTAEGVVRLDDPAIAVWTAYSGQGADGNMAWFAHFEDRVTVKNPDEEILGKMHRIATAMGARVQGDDGEEYGPDGAPIDMAPPSPVDEPKKPQWKFWK